MKDIRKMEYLKVQEESIYKMELIILGTLKMDKSMGMENYLNQTDSHTMAIG